MVRENYTPGEVKRIIFISRSLYLFEDELFSRDNEVSFPDLSSLTEMNDLIKSMDKYPEIFDESLKIYRDTREKLMELLGDPLRNLRSERWGLVSNWENASLSPEEHRTQTERQEDDLPF